MRTPDWPLMKNNISNGDLEKVIDYLRLDDPKLTSGKNVYAFEKEWSAWLGVKYSVFVSSGSSANLLTLAALKETVGGGEIIVSPLNWVSDIASIIQTGFTPVFADISLKTLAMDTGEVVQKITSKTKAVFLTHILGFNGLTQTLVGELQKRHIPLIEDVCESHGATFKRRKLGTFGLISNFSFYYAHHMSTIEGGVVSTNDEHIYQIIRMLRAHGMVRESTSQKLKSAYHKKYPDLNPDFIFAYPAYNMRPTEIGAIIGRSQLKRLNTNNAVRNRNHEIFLKNLDPHMFVTNFDIEGSSNYAFALILKHADMTLSRKVMNVLASHRIEFRRGTSGGGNQLRQPYLKKYVGHDEYKSYPNVDHVHFYGFYIGNYPSLKKEQIYELCSLLNHIR